MILMTLTLTGLPVPAPAPGRHPEARHLPTPRPHPHPLLQFIVMTLTLTVLSAPLAAGAVKFGVRNAYFWIIRWDTNLNFDLYFLASMCISLLELFFALVIYEHSPLPCPNPIKARPALWQAHRSTRLSQPLH